MHKVLYFSAITLIVGIVFSSNSWAGLAGSKHDFTSEAWASQANGDMCRPCHTPHGAISGQPVLWNHTLSATVYTPYSSDTMAQESLGPNATSKLCLSCHDGITALDSFSGAVGETFISGGALLGTDLSNDHPVGIKWQHTDGMNYDCNVCHDGDPALPWTLTKKQDMPLYRVSDGMGGFDYTVECASCHDPHNKYNLDHLLRVTNVGSELCLQCHVK